VFKLEVLPVYCFRCEHVARRASTDYSYTRNVKRAEVETPAVRFVVKICKKKYVFDTTLRALKAQL